MKFSVPAAAGLLAVAFSVSVEAHHSLAMFDMDKAVPLNGTLKSVQWTNPHSWFVLAAAGTDGAVKDWQIEGPSPNGLVRKGWKHADISEGQRVTVTFHPRKDGSAGGMLVALRFQDGKELRLMPDGPPPDSSVRGTAAPGAAPAGGPPPQ